MDGNSVLSPEHNTILSMIYGLWKNRCLCLIIEFKIPEILCNTEEASLSIDDIAKKTGCCSSKYLYPIMRVLAQWGIGVELDNKHFIKNNAMELLRRDNGTSLGHLAAYLTGDENYMAMRSLGKGVKECRPPFVLEHGMTHFSYMNDIEEQAYSKEKMLQGLSEDLIGSTDRRRSLAVTYNAAMQTLSYFQGLSDMQGINNVQKAFPWSTCNRIIDIAGSNGSFLASILSQPDCQHIQGFVLELPEVINDAYRHLNSLGVQENRIKFICQDITKPFNRKSLGLEPVDAIIIKNFLGMYFDDHHLVINIFKSCSDLLPKINGKLLIIEICSREPGDTTHNVGINGLQHGLESLHWINITGGSVKTKSEWINTLQQVTSQTDLRFNQAYETFTGGYTIFELRRL